MSANRTVYLLLGVCLWASAFDAEAQRHQRSDSLVVSIPLVTSFEIGLLALDIGAFKQAEQAFRAVYVSDPTLGAPDRGSAAYWLGRSLYKQNQPNEALAVWESGWQTLHTASLCDPMLSDALIRRAFKAGASYRFSIIASSVYLDLLHCMEAPPPEGMGSIWARHLLPLALVVPDSLRQDVDLEPADAVLAEGLAAGASERLAAWWRSMDVLPASSENERLIEHLERVVYASTHFLDANSEEGYDDRGRIYIRLGPPGLRQRVRFDPIGLTSVSVRTENGFDHIRSASMPPSLGEGDFWVYPDVDPSAHYLFIRGTGGVYRLGLPQDLLPSGMRHGWEADLEKEFLFRKALEELYLQLAPNHSEYARRLIELNKSEGGRLLIATSQWLQTRDRRAALQRDERVPPSYTNVLDRAEHLPIVIRWARFLDPDGTTRTELYWTFQARELLPARALRQQQREEHAPSGHYLLNLSAVRLSEDYQPRARTTRPYLLQVPEGPLDDDMVMPTQTFIAHGDTGRYHLGLQWDAYGAEPLGGRMHVGPQAKLTTMRVDAIEALRSDPALLEMSDLKPLRIVDERLPIEDAVPHASTAITVSTQLACYFEVYHLRRGEDGRAHFSVAYTVERSAHRGLLRRRQPEGRTIAQTSYMIDGATARETIVLDLSEVQRGDEIALTVHVRDEASGQTVERTLAFEVHQE